MDCSKFPTMKKFMAIASTLALLMALPACYYDNRAKILAQNPAEDCDTTNVTFSTNISPIIKNNCAVAACHNNSSQAAGLNLDQFNDLQKIAQNGLLVTRITATGSSLMPQGGPALPDCQIKKITAWVQDGAPQN